MGKMLLMLFTIIITIYKKKSNGITNREKVTAFIAVPVHYG
jgi:hypothetical protein